MSSKTSTQWTSPEVLLGILSTLQRLETLFQDQNDRLNAIELSLQPDIGVSRLDEHTPEKDTFDVHSSSEYLQSVLKLKRFFDLDSRSVINQYEQAAPVSSGLSHGDGFDHALRAFESDEWRSVSIYPSRPMSRLELDIPAVPQLPLMYRSAAVNRDYGCETLEGSVSIRDDHIPVSAITSDSYTSRDRESLGSIETALTTPSSANSKKSFETTDAGFRRMDGLRGPLRRSISTTQNPASGLGSDQSLTDNKNESIWSFHIVSRVSRSRDVFSKTTVRCLQLPSRLVAAAGRAMINQQLKMLDTGA
ncbi:hypothetical protein HJFPF1_04130 [Paramyrothecium foliicola]|nr:hypothetical protein HJFPF1_04130 [Paramyrothecium foliicola]